MTGPDEIETRRPTAGALRLALLGATLLALALAGSAPARAQTLALTMANDLAAGNPFDDDRYTAAIEATWAAGGREVRFAERMFTDREAGRRFDETWLEVASPLPGAGRWFGTWSAGAVRVGRGLFGEPVQNAVHEAVGVDRVRLAYDDRATLHPALGATWSRRILPGGRALSFVRSEVATAPGFRHHALVAVDATFALGGGVLLGTTAGARWSAAEHDLLAPHVETFGPAWEVRLAWRGLVEVAWSRNDDGVGQRHVRLGVRLPFPSR